MARGTRRKDAPAHVLDVFAVDLHVHTRFFHGFGPRPTAYDPLGARLVATVARERDLDALALTNHDYVWHRAAERPAFLPGIEVTTTEGHLLVVGPDPPRSTNPGVLEPTEAVALAHEHDCAAIVAHPFRNSRLLDTDAPFDAVEINGKHPQNQARVDDAATERDLAMVGGSDAHYPFEVGRAYTRVEADDCSPESVVAAIRDGRVRPVVKADALDRALRPVYRTIHRRKRHVT